jgi:hypothetical protein
MASKFGTLGDLDLLVREVRRVVGNASAVLGNVRCALENGAIAAGGLTEARAAEVLFGVEQDLDGLLNGE